MPAAQLPIAVKKISNADLAQWLASKDKKGMRSAIVAFFDKVAAKKKADKIAKAKATRKAKAAGLRGNGHDTGAACNPGGV